MSDKNLQSQLPRDLIMPPTRTGLRSFAYFNRGAAKAPLF